MVAATAHAAITMKRMITAARVPLPNWYIVAGLVDGDVGDVEVSGVGVGVGVGASVMFVESTEAVDAFTSDVLMNCLKSSGVRSGKRAMDGEDVLRNDMTTLYGPVPFMQRQGRHGCGFFDDTKMWCVCSLLSGNTSPHRFTFLSTTPWTPSIGPSSFSCGD